MAQVDWWLWLLLVLIVIALGVALAAVVQGKRRSGGVIASRGRRRGGSG
ncbi:MAG: hypothetical protein JWL64_125 [Frankiales bacterium]|nr:hypothetical protein [Frankiales bacterium]